MTELASLDEETGPLSGSQYGRLLRAAEGEQVQWWPVKSTYRIDAASGSFVLRRQPPGVLLKSAHAVDQEFLVMGALAETPVPVPMVYHLCEDPEVIGSMFYLMEFCEGHIHWQAALPEIESSSLRSQMYVK